MSFNFNGIPGAEVTLTGLPEYTATIVSGSRTSAGTSTILTVPAGKKARILSITMSAGCDQSTANGGIQRTRVLLNSAIGCELVLFVASVGQHDNTSLIWNYDACPVLEETQTIQLVTDTTTIKSYVTISYVLEDA